MKVHIGCRNAVNLTLRFGDSLKNAECTLLHRLGKFTPLISARISACDRP
jgi:hypothetical protein